MFREFVCSLLECHFVGNAGNTGGEVQTERGTRNMEFYSVVWCNELVESVQPGHLQTSNTTRTTS